MLSTKAVPEASDPSSEIAGADAAAPISHESSSIAEKSTASPLLLTITANKSEGREGRRRGLQMQSGKHGAK